MSIDCAELDAVQTDIADKAVTPRRCDDLECSFDSIALEPFLGLEDKLGAPYSLLVLTNNVALGEMNLPFAFGRMAEEPVRLVEVGHVGGDNLEIEVYFAIDAFENRQRVITTDEPQERAVVNTVFLEVTEILKVLRLKEFFQLHAVRFSAFLLASDELGIRRYRRNFLTIICHILGF